MHSSGEAQQSNATNSIEPYIVTVCSDTLSTRSGLYCAGEILIESSDSLSDDSPRAFIQLHDREPRAGLHQAEKIQCIFQGSRALL